MAELPEVLDATPELAVHPEAPLTNLGASDDHSPRTALIGHDRVLVCSVTVLHSRSLEVLVSGRAQVGVTALEHKRHKRPGVIMTVARIVRRQPVMQSNRAPRGLEAPTNEIRARIEP